MYQIQKVVNSLQNLSFQERELQNIDTRTVTPGSSLTRLTSAFQADHFLSNGHIPGDVSPSTTTMSFTYER